MSTPLFSKMATVHRGRASQFFIDFWRWVFIVRHLGIFIGVVERARSVVAPRESWISFFFRLLYWRWIRNSRQCRRNFRSGRYTSTGHEHIKDAVATGRPVIFVIWPHGVSDIHEFIPPFPPNTLVVTTSQWSYTPNTSVVTTPTWSYPNPLFVDERQSPLALVKIRNFLCEQKFFLVWSFVGPIGDSSIPVNILGSRLLLKRGYPVMAKLTNAVVLPVTQYVDTDRAPHFCWHPSLFAEGELAQMSERQILEKTVDFFTGDLIASGRYQLDFHQLFHRFCHDSVEGKK